MLALVLLAQVVSSTPAATPAPALGAASSAVSSKPKTLADVARERKLGKKGVAGGTLSVAGASGMPVLLPEHDAPRRQSAGSERHSRVKSAEADVLAARRALDQEAVRKGMTAEDTAIARQKVEAARRELSEAREAAKRGN